MMEAEMAKNKPNFVSHKAHKSSPAKVKIKTSRAKQIAAGKTAEKVAAKLADTKLRRPYY